MSYNPLYFASLYTVARQPKCQQVTSALFTISHYSGEGDYFFIWANGTGKVTAKFVTPVIFIRVGCECRLQPDPK